MVVVKRKFNGGNALTKLLCSIWNLSCYRNYNLNFDSSVSMIVSRSLWATEHLGQARNSAKIAARCWLPPLCRGFERSSFSLGVHFNVFATTLFKWREFRFCLFLSSIRSWWSLLLYMHSIHPAVQVSVASDHRYLLLVSTLICNSTEGKGPKEVGQRPRAQIG